MRILLYVRNKAPLWSHSHLFSPHSSEGGGDFHACFTVEQTKLWEATGQIQGLTS